MNEEKNNPTDPNEDMDSFEVVQLETEGGESAEFVILDKVEIQGKTYALMALLEVMENMENQTEEEFENMLEESGLVHIMRIEGEHYEEIGEEEFNRIEGPLQDSISSLFEPEEPEED